MAINVTIDLFTVSDEVLLGGRHGKNCSECTRKVKSSMPNKLRVLAL